MYGCKYSGGEVPDPGLYQDPDVRDHGKGLDQVVCTGWAETVVHFYIVGCHKKWARHLGLQHILLLGLICNNYGNVLTPDIEYHEQ